MLGALIRGNMVWVLSQVFFLEFFENFQNSYVKGQSYFHAVGTIEETDGLLKDLKRSALSVVIHKSANLKLSSSPWGVRFEVFWYWKNIQNCIIVIFHLMCLTKSSFQLAGYKVGWHLLFHNWSKTIKWPFLFPFAKNATKIVCVCTRKKFHLCWK